MILSDLLHFLCVYSVLLVGFSAAIVTLITHTPLDQMNVTNTTQGGGRGFDNEPLQCKEPSYNDIRYTILELFKFTIGMGNLEFTDDVRYKEVFYIVLISYIVLTYILLLNMLIALMGNTVERISKQSENIWNLQRASTILDMERTLPRWLRCRLQSKESKKVCFSNEPNHSRRFFRVEEMNWRQWRSDLNVTQEEDPGHHMMRLQPVNRSPRHRWNMNLLLERIHARRGQRPQMPSGP